MEIKWHDTDPATGERRYLCAERFAGVWRFRWKLQRRGDWTRGLEPTRALWEHVLESLQRRYRRREGVDDKDIEQVEKILNEIRQRDDESAGEPSAIPTKFDGAGPSEFSPAETVACRRLIDLAVQEDVGTGDVTSLAVIAEDLQGSAACVARRPGVLAGLGAVALVLRTVDARLRLERLVHDGSTLRPGQRLARVTGPMRGILAAERIALNFLQHLSGIATLTRQYVDAVAGLPVQILDTRKTLPGWRLLQKYAVRCGGGHNHRMGLYDGILIKDNHLAALPVADRKSKIADAVPRAQQWGERSRQENRPLTGLGSPVVVEIEVDDLEQLQTALACRPSIVLLDNMTCETMRDAVRCRDASAPGVRLEASGGITLPSVRAIAETGVDRISIGALTHSAAALDLALDYE